MTERVQRSTEESIRVNATQAERWRGLDQGLVTCWEVGRQLRRQDPDLAARACAGELPVLGWKGGVAKKLTVKKFGPLNYLAQLQGLCGEDLDIDMTREYELTCSRTRMTVVYTANKSRWSQA